MTRDVPPMSEWPPAGDRGPHRVPEGLQRRAAGAWRAGRRTGADRRRSWPSSSSPTARAPVVTDGPFPESKELLAGYRMIDVESIERALEIAARASAAPGPRRRADRAGDRGPRGDGPDRATERWDGRREIEGLLREAAPRALAAVVRRFGDFGDVRGRGAGGDDRGGDAVAAAGRAREPRRLARPRRLAAADRPHPQRLGAAPTRGRGRRRSLEPGTADGDRRPAPTTPWP